MEINYDVIKEAYGFTISKDGGLYGLINGDMGYEHTGIQLDEYTVGVWKKGVEEQDRRINLGTFKKAEWGDFEELKINYNTIKEGRSFILDADGQVQALVNGKSRYAATGIVIDPDTLAIWKMGLEVK